MNDTQLEQLEHLILQNLTGRVKQKCISSTILNEFKSHNINNFLFVYVYVLYNQLYQNLVLQSAALNKLQPAKEISSSVKCSVSSYLIWIESWLQELEMHRLLMWMWIFSLCSLIVNWISTQKYLFLLIASAGCCFHLKEENFSELSEV